MMPAILRVHHPAPQAQLHMLTLCWLQLLSQPTRRQGTEVAPQLPCMPTPWLQAWMLVGLRARLGGPPWVLWFPPGVHVGTRGPSASAPPCTWPMSRCSAPCTVDASHLANCLFLQHTQIARISTTLGHLQVTDLAAEECTSLLPLLSWQVAFLKGTP